MRKREKIEMAVERAISNHKAQFRIKGLKYEIFVLIHWPEQKKFNVVAVSNICGWYRGHTFHIHSDHLKVMGPNSNDKTIPLRTLVFSQVFKGARVFVGSKEDIIKHFTN